MKISEWLQVKATEPIQSETKIHEENRNECSVCGSIYIEFAPWKGRKGQYHSWCTRCDAEFERLKL